MLSTHNLSNSLKDTCCKCLSLQTPFFSFAPTPSWCKGKKNRDFIQANFSYLLADWMPPRRISHFVLKSARPAFQDWQCYLINMLFGNHTLVVLVVEHFPAMSSNNVTMSRQSLSLTQSRQKWKLFSLQISSLACLPAAAGEEDNRAENIHCFAAFHF